MTTDCNYDMDRINHIGNDLVAAFNDGYQHGLADARAERKTGQWITTYDEYGETWMCSQCCEEWTVEETTFDEFPQWAHYCPNCGTRMVTDDI